MDELETIAAQLQNGAAKNTREEFEETLQDLRFNTSKVHEHGQRADRIVRSMLQHAGGRPGQRTKIAVNELLREYVKLAYHGFRATDVSINITIHESYADDLPSVDAAPHDLGRVFLNILTNGFHAVQEKAAIASSSYTPTIHVSSTKDSDTKQVLIRVEDNGVGIPKRIQHRIFEPFFTNKAPAAAQGLDFPSVMISLRKAMADRSTWKATTSSVLLFSFPLPYAENTPKM